MLVLVTMRTCDAVGYTEKRDAISHDWSYLFNKYGILPIFISNVLEANLTYFDILKPKALLLTGGEDVNDDFISISSEKKNNRDRTEYLLLNEAIKRNIPVLGVCRGFQLINKYFGGSHQQFDTHLKKSHIIHIKNSHYSLPENSTFQVNSFHSNIVFNEQLGAGLIPFAYASDDTIEGYYHISHNIRSIQWHPERNNITAEILDTKVIQDWLGVCD